MARRPKKTKRKQEPEKIKHGPLIQRPFEQLKGFQARETAVEAEPEPPNPAPAQPGDEDMFRMAMDGVRPMNRRKGYSAGSPPEPRPPGPDPRQQDETEVMTYLEDLVYGRINFDIVDTDEYIEGYIRGFRPVILEQLRTGRFSVQAHLDLHGMTVTEAEEAVRDFILEAVSLNYRCVLLVHGRGMNSKDQIPVLKSRLEKFLLKNTVRKHIIAFTSARPHDGGAGASYVLLRARK